MREAGSAMSVAMPGGDRWSIEVVLVDGGCENRNERDEVKERDRRLEFQDDGMDAASLTYQDRSSTVNGRR
jgi:hypothetical protein